MTDLCGEVHPERAEVSCEKPKPCWGVHVSGKYALAWPGRPMVSSQPQGSRLAAMAGRSRRSAKTGPPIVRTIDPSTAHQAAELFEPNRDTRSGRVLAYLRERAGQWVDVPELVHPDIGGSEGTRRVRELRQMGHPIETRLKPGSTTIWQHRIVPTVVSDAATTKE